MNSPPAGPRRRGGGDRSADSARARIHRRIGTYYQGDGIVHPARLAAYQKAMAGVAERSASDDEAQIFHALAILGVAYNSPPDKTYAKQRKRQRSSTACWPKSPTIRESRIT